MQMHYGHEDNFKGFVTRFKPHSGYSKGFEKIKALGYEFGLFNSVFICKALPFFHACKCIRQGHADRFKGFEILKFAKTKT